MQFGRGDFYYVTKLKPPTTNITVDSEIADAIWMPLSKFRLETKQEMLQEVIKLIDNNVKGMDEKVLNSIITTRKPFKCYFATK